MQETYLPKINAQIKKMDEEIVKLQKMAKEKGSQTEAELNKILEKYQLNRKDLQDKMEKFRQTGKEAAKDVTAGVDRALEEMKTAFNKARSRFQ